MRGKRCDLNHVPLQTRLKRVNLIVAHLISYEKRNVKIRTQDSFLVNIDYTFRDFLSYLYLNHVYLILHRSAIPDIIRPSRPPGGKDCFAYVLWGNQKL